MELKNKWIYLPWLKNNDLDHLIHSEDLKHLPIDGLGIAKCVNEEENGYIKIKIKELELRVKKKGIIKLLPIPAYEWNDSIILLKKQKLGKVLDFMWHFKDEKYYYFVEIEGNKLNKRLTDSELKKIETPYNKELR